MGFSSLATLLRRPQLLGVPRDLKLPAAAAFLQAQASWSIVVFRGSLEEKVHAWLGTRTWRHLEQAPVRAGFAELYERVRHQRKVAPNQWEVMKATYVVAGHTVLLDPEMVVLGQSNELSELCRTEDTHVIGAIWERVSRTVEVTEIATTGVVRQATWIGGVNRKEIDPWPQVTGAGPEELVEVMRTAQLPVDAIFGDALDATALLLAE